MRGRVLPFIGTAAVMMVIGSRDASAEEPRPMSNEMRAEQLFRAGEKKFDAGKHAEACLDFAGSLKLAPKLGTLLNVALCHETTGKLATAWAEFHHAAAWAAQNNQKERREYAMQHIQGIEPRLPRVGLQLPVTSAISNIDLDGEPLPEQRWYLPLYLDPGEHAIAVTAPGKKRTTVSFRVVDSPAEQLVVVPALTDDPKTKADGTLVTTKSEGLPLAGLILVGIGAVGVVTGATFGAIAIAGDDADAKGPATVSTIAFSAGALALAAGGWVLLTSRPGGPRVSALGFATSF